MIKIKTYKYSDEDWYITTINIGLREGKGYSSSYIKSIFRAIKDIHKTPEAIFGHLPDKLKFTCELPGLKNSITSELICADSSFKGMGTADITYYVV